MAEDIAIDTDIPVRSSDQVKGAAKDIAGKIQKESGKLVGSKQQQAEGLEKQLEGKVQQKVGDLKEAVKDVAKH